MAHLALDEATLSIESRELDLAHDVRVALDRIWHDLLEVDEHLRLVEILRKVLHR